MRRWYWQLRGLGSCCVVRIEARVRGGRPLAVLVQVERAAGEQVDAGGDRQAHQHGDIGPAERARDRRGRDKAEEATRYHPPPFQNASPLFLLKKKKPNRQHLIFNIPKRRFYKIP